MLHIKEVDAKLYDFLKQHEVQLYTKDFNKDKTVYAIAFIYFENLSDLVEVVGEHHFDEGGIEVNMLSEYVVVELNDIIESNGHYLSSYQGCIDEWEWNRYKEQIEEMERE